jgi:uncharacterized delta-60 repeat protein
MPRFFHLALLAALVLLLAAPAGEARTRLDRGFGTNGRAVGEAPPNAPLSGFAMARGSDGTLYVAEGRRVNALRPDGSRELRFGGTGFADYPFPPWPDYLTVQGLAVDGEGRVVIAAGAFDNEPAEGEPAAVATVIRYLANGTRDPGFGIDGVVSTTFGFPRPRDESGLAPASAEHVGVSLGAVGVDEGGRVVLGGSYRERTVKCPNGSAYEMPLAFLARLQPDGTPDPSFEQNGVAVQSGLGEITALSLAPEGVIDFTATLPGCGLPRKGALARVGEQGLAANGFGTKGRRSLSEAPDLLARDSSGRLQVSFEPHRVPARNSHSTTAIRRFRPNGSSDGSFGRKGKTMVRLPGVSGRVGAIAADPRGRLLLAGAGHPPGSEPPRRFVLKRLSASGALDRGFGFKGGAVTTTFGSRTRASGRGIALAPDGSIFVGGSLGARYLFQESGFALARYRP